MSTNDNKNIAEVKEKKPNKLKEWWKENWGEVTGAVMTIAGVAGIVYLGKKGLDGAMDSMATKNLVNYGKAAGLDLLNDSGTYAEKLEKAVTKIREERDVDNLTDTIKEKVDELNELCKDKGVEVMLGAMLGTEDNPIGELDTYVDNLSIN